MLYYVVVRATFSLVTMRSKSNTFSFNFIATIIIAYKWTLFELQWEKYINIIVSIFFNSNANSFIYLFGVLRRFQHCTGHITMGSWKGRGNQDIQLVKVLYCKLPTNSKLLPAFPLEAMPGTKPRPQRWEARVLPLCHRAP